MSSAYFLAITIYCRQSGNGNQSKTKTWRETLRDEMTSKATSDAGTMQDPLLVIGGSGEFQREQQARTQGRPGGYEDLPPDPPPIAKNIPKRSTLSA